MKLPPRLIILLIIGAIVLIAGFLLQSRGPEPSETGAKQVLSAPPPVNTTPLHSGSIAFKFTADPSIPKTLPGYSIKTPERRQFTDFISNAAPALGFTASFSGILQNKTLSLTWVRGNESELSGTHSDTGAVVLYRRVLSPTRPGTSLPQSAVASQFLSLLIEDGQMYKITREQRSGGAPTGLLVLDKPQPKLFTEYAYSYAIGGYAITDASYAVKQASIVIDEWNVIRFASVVIPPSITEQTGNISLLQKEDILENIRLGRAGILHTYAANSPEWGVLPTFTSFEVENVRIVYAPKDGYFFPAFLLSGTGTNSSGVAQKSQFFMWAFSGF